jgi:hypothetical protein
MGFLRATGCATLFREPCGKTIAVRTGAAAQPFFSFARQPTGARLATQRNQSRMS